MTRTAKHCFCSDLEEEVNVLRQQLAYLKKALYGQKSEKTEVIMENAEQLSMFNEAEESTEEKVIEKADKITVVTHERKKHSTHRDSFENLETEEVIHEAEDKVCPECGSEMEVIGKEFVRDELVYVPARMFVRKHYVETTRCVSCGIDESRDNENTEDTIVYIIWRVGCGVDGYNLFAFIYRICVKNSNPAKTRACVRDWDRELSL